MTATIYDKLEEAAVYYTFNNDDQKANAIQLSIAISLKRIADKLELSQKQPVVMDAEEFKKFKEFNDIL